eukprot:CAMPEP_0198430106 /NCGR_PEP_ID=MMETSP1452-20131203/11622_1 /TAXON_ID=1181717 /ORGANISM="Synchroma pusillum, Strain CCMP3072" /LENGTH=73 /DNA_ID=CAMNT_0044150535 /DNA_START=1 /DNA_END=219 /DNA_ORIENTATION=+
MPFSRSRATTDDARASTSGPTAAAGPTVGSMGGGTSTVSRSPAAEAGAALPAVAAMGCLLPTAAAAAAAADPA